MVEKDGLMNATQEEEKVEFEITVSSGNNSGMIRPTLFSWFVEK
jgi:hypothetical protein